MPKITRKDSTAPQSITMNTTDKKKSAQYQWWKSSDEAQSGMQMIATASFLKDAQLWRQRQAVTYAKLYGNQALFSFIGTNVSSVSSNLGLPPDRPAFNIIQSVTETLVSRITQNRPTPVFLTDNSDYKERNLAKKLNNFILGEFYQAKAYEKAEFILRDACVEGTGCLKVYETMDHKVGLDRVMLTELLIDPNESMYGDPRQLYQFKLMDRQMAKEAFPDCADIIDGASKAYPDSSADSAKSVSDLIMVVEAWHLKSGEKAKDGKHMIACSNGVLFEEDWTKDKFPFVFLHYAPRMLGFWSQGVSERLMGTQMELNSLFFTIAQAIKLVGVPRVFIENGSKVVKSHNNNQVGVIITYSGTKPSYEIAPCNAEELYMERDRLIQYGFRQEGVSEMAAASQKPAGLDSGEAIRTYDDINTDRMAALAKRYDNFFVDLAYLMIDLAKDIAEREGKYETVYPNKNGAKEIDLPKASLLKDPFVIQCFNMSSLPRDPAGRMAKITEMIQGGMISIKEGRRLLDYPDLSQVETLANAGEERIFQYLDEIVEDGKEHSADSFMDLSLAKELVVQYYNLYVPAKLEEDRAQMLRDFSTSIDTFMQAANPPPAPMPAPQASPMPLPQSPLVPNAAPQAA